MVKGPGLFVHVGKCHPWKNASLKLAITVEKFTAVAENLMRGRVEW